MSKKQTLKQLTDIWYKKLAKKGFEDIEQADGNLKRWDSLYFIARHTNFEGKSGPKEGPKEWGFNTLNFTSRQEYYQLAGAFLYEHKFETETEQLIWSMHSEGKSVKEIYSTLRTTKHKTYRRGVSKLIKRLEEIMAGRCQPKKT